MLQYYFSYNILKKYNPSGGKSQKLFTLIKSFDTPYILICISCEKEKIIL